MGLWWPLHGSLAVSDTWIPLYSFLLLQLMGTDSSGSSSLRRAESATGQEKLFAGRFQGCSWDPLLVLGGVVTVGFTAPAPSNSHWDPTTSAVSYPILTPASQLPLWLCPKTSLIPFLALSLLFNLVFLPWRFLSFSLPWLFPDTHLTSLVWP